MGDRNQLIDYEAFFSQEAKLMRPPSLAGLLLKFAGVPDCMTMHVGLPPNESFPLSRLDATTTSGQTLAVAEPAEVAAAQQYNFTPGHAALLTWIRGVVGRCHKPCVPTEVVVTAGAIHAISCIISCLAERGDTVVVDEFSYTHVLECVMLPRGLKLLPVRMDSNGMDPEHLDQQLSAAAAAAAAPSGSGRPPRLLYVIPSGQNPTGVIMPISRKQRIYEVCRKHGVLILEDDAYYWLQYPATTTTTTTTTTTSTSEQQQQQQQEEASSSSSSSSTPGLQLPPSFLSLDVDGRVIRVDTFAKLLGPGYRLGWITGAPQLVSKVGMFVQGHMVGASSLSMVLVSRLLSSWGSEGFEAFTHRQQALYRGRAQAAAAAAARHLGGLAEWRAAEAGMFMWIRLTAVDDLDDEVVRQLVEQRVVVVPGRLFWSDQEAVQAGRACPFVRVSFAALSEGGMEEGFARLARAIKAVAAARQNVPAVAP